MLKPQCCCQIYGNGERPYSLHDRNRANNVGEQNCKLNEKLYNISYMGKISELFVKVFLERTYLLDRWLFRL